MGGAEVLNMDKVVGNFAPGKRMDALVVDLNVADSPVDIFDFETLSEKFQKFIYLANDRNITHIYVDGRLVKSPLP
jgi:cytosine/adenosine deaminase-related metal-dependent hydrolase